MRALALLVLLAACGTTAPDATVNETDPAITDALADPIMADSRLALQDRGGAIGVPTGIDGGEHTQTLGQIAANRVREAPFAGCDAKIDYAFVWMARLPTELGLPETARVSEAAGSNAKACNLRIVRYQVARPPVEVEAFYRKQGYALTSRNGAISGVRSNDGSAFWVSISATQNGATVDFVTNRGS
jgi:hypothetical protein